MTPDQVKHFFDLYAVVIMLLWGVAVKYFPPLAKVPNSLIAWFNSIGYILGRLAVGNAYAGPLDGLAQPIGVAAGAILYPIVARQGYETWLRALFEGLFGWKKAVPK